MSQDKYKSIMFSQVPSRTFLTQLSEENDMSLKASSIHSYLKSYLDFFNGKNPVSQSFLVSQSLFVGIIVEIPDLFNNLNECNDMEHFSTRQKKNIKIKNSTLYLETLILCLKSNKCIEDLISVLQTTLRVLDIGYTHCKDSEHMYGDLFEEFTDQLAVFFNKIQETQSLMILDVESLLTQALTQSHMPNIASIASDLGKLCGIVTALDVVIATKLWRVFTKLISQFCDYLKRNFVVNPTVDVLISSISDIVCECKAKIADCDKIEDSDVKIFVFQLNIVMKIFNNFKGHFTTSLEKIQLLVLEIYSLLLLCYSVESSPELNIDSLKESLKSHVPPMVSLFCSDEKFLVFSFDTPYTGASQKLHLPCILLKTDVLNSMLSKNENFRHDQMLDIMKTMFESLKKNSQKENVHFVGLKLPSAMFSVGQKVENVKNMCTLYQVIRFNLCELSKKMSDSDFSILETYLAVTLVSSTSEVVSLLASDVWIFRLRCGSVSYLNSSCVTVCEKYSLKSASNILKEHFKRMVKFLPSTEKQALLSRYPEIQPLFQHKGVKHRYVVPQMNAKEPNVNDVVAKSCMLIEELKSVSTDDQKLIRKACNILELFTLCASYMDNTQLMQSINISKFLFQSHVYEIEVAVLSFVRALSNQHLTQDSEFDNVTTNIGQLFAMCLKNSNYVLRHLAFDAYAAFARSTPHPDIIRKAIANDPDLSGKVQAFFKKEPPYTIKSDHARLKLLEQQIQQCPILAISLNSDESKKVLSHLLPAWSR